MININYNSRLCLLNYFYHVKDICWFLVFENKMIILQIKSKSKTFIKYILLFIINNHFFNLINVRYLVMRFYTFYFEGGKMCHLCCIFLDVLHLMFFQVHHYFVIFICDFTYFIWIVFIYVHRFPYKFIYLCLL